MNTGKIAAKGHMRKGSKAALARNTGAPVAGVPLEVLLTLSQAVRNRDTARFDYLSRGEGEAQGPRIEPIASWRRTVGGICSGGISSGRIGGPSRRTACDPGCRMALSLGGVKLPTTLAAPGLIGECTFVVHPVIAGRGPRLLDGVNLSSS